MLCIVIKPFLALIAGVVIAVALLVLLGKIFSILAQEVASSAKAAIGMIFSIKIPFSCDLYVVIDSHFRLRSRSQ